MQLWKRLLRLCSAVVLTVPVFAGAIIFDNADLPLKATTRSSGSGITAYLQIGSSDVTISQIAVYASPQQNGLLKFVIFSDVEPPGSDSGTLLFSSTVNVTASGSLNYILSDPFLFTLQAGQYYDIGAVSDSAVTQYGYDTIGNTQNGITSISSNQNIDSFDNPTLVGHAGADATILLFDASDLATPEPTSLVLVALGLMVCVAFRRFRGSRNSTC